MTTDRDFQFLRDDPPFESDDAFEQELPNKTKDELIDMLLCMRDKYRLSENKLLSVLKISSATRSALQFDELLRLVVESISRLMKAERSTLFLIDEKGEHLESQVLLGEENRQIKLEMGKGIAGWVAQTGETINTPDVTKDQHFFDSIDKQTGFKTKSILCVPVRNYSGKRIGAVQVLNSQNPNGSFSKEDEDLLTAIACQAGIVIENQKLFQSVVETKGRLEKRIKEVNILYEIERHLSKAHNLHNLLRIFTHKTALILNCGGAGVTIKVDKKMRLYLTMSTNKHEYGFQLRILTDKEIALTNKLTELFSETSQLHSETIKELQKEHKENKLDFIHEWIGIPLIDNKKVFGLVHAVNPIGRPNFNEEDVLLMQLVGSRIGEAIAARRRADELEKAERLAGIGGMLTGLVHDLKNSIGIISAYIQLMERSDNPDARKAYKEQGIKQLHQLTDMTQELLVFAKGENTLVLQLVDLQIFLNDFGTLLTPELNAHNISLSIEIDENCTVRIDPKKIHRALLNLIRNSVEAMDEHGHITISVTTTTKELEIDVKDTGRGIPPSIYDTLFDSFVTYGKKRGTGLGLAIVKNIIDLHEGSIHFDSEEGKGTIFHIKLPQALRNPQQLPHHPS